MKRKELNYKYMVELIDELVNSDFTMEMELKELPRSRPYTQKEAREMSELLGRVYHISHCISCKACRGKYEQA